MPLVYTGQESALDRRLAFFDKDSIDWGTYPLLGFYSRLLHLKQRNAALYIDELSGTQFLQDKRYDNLFVCIRRSAGKRLLVIANLSDRQIDPTLLQGNIEGHYTDVFTGKGVDLVKGELQHLKPWEYRVLEQ
jgi:alpha-amylase